MVNKAFPSTGNPEEDARIAVQIRRHDALESEGLCPNGCGPMTLTDEHTKECPVCHFTHWSNRPSSTR